MDKDLATEFARQACYRIDESTRMLQTAYADLDEADIWKRPNAASNSVGNLVLHLCGNIRQYAISALGGTEDLRERDAEFAARGGTDKAALLVKLQRTVEEAKAAIRAADAANLLRVRSVQGFQLSGLGIVLHVVEHYSYHTGQIAFWTKLLKDKDLGFYAGVDLTVH
ncbi:MAG: DinB family protein [Saprospiraceae bacterium]